VPWSPDPGVLDAYWNGKVVLRGSRNPANADTSEVLQIVFAPPNAFQLGAAGQFVIWSGVSGEAPQDPHSRVLGGGPLAIRHWPPHIAGFTLQAV
jgi:hypothetical protein